jgi:hypothetical protein
MAKSSRKKAAKLPMGAKMQAQAEQAAELLKALSNPQRLRVMCMLIDGEKTVGELNAEIELSPSARGWLGADPARIAKRFLLGGRRPRA